MKNKTRCPWPDGDEKMTKYHDEVWGVPVYDDQKLFAKLSLDLMQAGLMWRTILHKQENFMRAFDNFDIDIVANYDELKYEELMQDAGIVRNQLKIRAIINNARCFQEIQKEFGSFSNYIWGFVDGKTIQNKLNTLDEIPAKTLLSDTISKDLLRRGFKFVGSTIIYAWMQAIGMVNDHMIDCFRYKELGGKE
ncbi:MAG: DNA-3-methyladenine glycosylase I [Firmicutes bacterium]|nr:DNA-3-methyladenine glycosylase I [Bacillota bacterium]